MSGMHNKTAAFDVPRCDRLSQRTPIFIFFEENYFVRKEVIKIMVFLRSHLLLKRTASSLINESSCLVTYPCVRQLQTSPWCRSSDDKAEETVKKGHTVKNRDIVPGMVNNRNPHNLEKLRIADKATGWDLEVPDRSYWNKLVIDLSSRHINAKVVHVFGRTPVSVSTKEWCIKQYLYNTRDDVAAKTVGDVLGHRCLQVGITELACFLPEEERKKEKVSIILSALQEAGISLEEPSQIIMPWDLNYPTLPEKSWEVYEDFEDKLDVSEYLAHKNKKDSSSRQS